MLTPAEMKQVELLVLERDMRAVTEGLGRLGVVHLSRAEAAEGGDLVKPTRLEGDLARVHELNERIDALCDALAVPEDVPPAEVPFVSHRDLENVLKPIERKLGDVLERRKRLDAEIETQYQVLRDLETFRPVEVPTEALRELSFLHFAIGTLPAGEVGAVREEVGDRALVLPYRSPDGTQRLVALAGRTGRFALDSVLEQHGFQGEKLPELKEGTPSQVVERTRNRLVALAQEQDAIREDTRAQAGRVGPRLAAWRLRLRVDEKLLEAQAYFGRTAATVLISGYVPSRRIDALRQEMLRTTDGRVVIEVDDPDQDDANAPTLMQNPALLKPFEMLVAGYGYPGYREIEPTPLLAVTFLLMFGIMFGDVGHGAVLVVAGLVARRASRVPKIRDFGMLLVLAGCASMVFGWVFGSVFGVEGALSPPAGGWFEPLRGGNINRLLGATVALGVAIITLGLILNIVNCIKARDYFAMTVHRFGIVGFIFYWGALGLGIRSVVLKAGPPTTLELGLFIVLPLLVLFLREPLHYLLTRKDGGERPSLFAGAIEGFVDVLETISGYIANTVSFVRVGAFALAHAALCVAIFSTEATVRTMPGGPLWSVLVVVGGNALVIALEGLVVSIQATRLEYYEFFGKFFKGEGKAYDPFKLT